LKRPYSPAHALLTSKSIESNNALESITLSSAEAVPKTVCLLKTTSSRDSEEFMELCDDLSDVAAASQNISFIPDTQVDTAEQQGSQEKEDELFIDAIESNQTSRNGSNAWSSQESLAEKASKDQSGWNIMSIGEKVCMFMFVFDRVLML
jgi:hypothetical protein